MVLSIAEDISEGNLPYTKTILTVFFALFSFFFFGFRRGLKSGEVFSRLEGRLEGGGLRAEADKKRSFYFLFAVSR